MIKLVSMIFGGLSLIGLISSTTYAFAEEDLVKLGGALYRDRNLSRNQNQSCMTCHQPSAGFADPENRVAPTTLVVSDGSTPTDFGGRNAPSAAYSGFSPVFQYAVEEEENEGLYMGGVFWDGRATGFRLNDPLVEQALGPFLNPVEMGLSTKEEVIAIVQQAKYADLFVKVFGADAFINVDEAYNNIGRAIAAFERSRLFMKFNSKFDKFWKEQGKDVSSFGTNEDGTYKGLPEDFRSRYLSGEEATGLALFNAVDKGNCAACHLTTNHTDGTTVYPPLFTDFTYDNLGIPVNPQIAALTGDAQPIDYGLGARVAEIMEAAPPEIPLTMGIAEAGTPDQGDIAIIESEAGKFKVSSLRNVGRTAPYGHNGYFATLEEITHFYNTRDVESWPAPEVPMNVNQEELGNLGLSTAEELALVAFMKTLTD